MNPASGDTFQVDTAMEAFWNGGWFGLGPGEGIAKRSLPDSHTDFVFAVAAEEFGIILCLVLVALFAFVVIRALTYLPERFRFTSSRKWTADERHMLALFFAEVELISPRSYIHS